MCFITYIYRQGNWGSLTCLIVNGRAGIKTLIKLKLSPFPSTTLVHWCSCCLSTSVEKVQERGVVLNGDRCCLPMECLKVDWRTFDCTVTGVMGCCWIWGVGTMDIKCSTVLLTVQWKIVPLEMLVVPLLIDKGLGDSETSLPTFSEVIKGAMAVLVVIFYNFHLYASYNVGKPNPYFPSKTTLFFFRCFVYMPLVTLITIY